MKREICDICDRPTGNAGVMDDSIQCEMCGDIICEDCQYEDTEGKILCNECGRDYYGFEEDWSEEE